MSRELVSVITLLLDEKEARLGIAPRRQSLETSKQPTTRVGPRLSFQAYNRDIWRTSCEVPQSTDPHFQRFCRGTSRCRQPVAGGASRWHAHRDGLSYLCWRSRWSQSCPAEPVRLRLPLLPSRRAGYLLKSSSFC